MKPLSQYEVWFVTGSQHLYGPKALEQVAADSKAVVAALDAAPGIPVKIVFKPVMVTPDSITELMLAANASPACAGVITWCHTFSPSKMWINGLKVLAKPALQLHTQFNRDIPWSAIDMDYMNLHQAAHGDREHGFIWTRLRKDRKVVVGFWQDPKVQAQVGAWTRAAAAWADWQGAKFIRFGDNMREVAVTDGDKVSALYKLGYGVDYYAVGDLVKRIDAASDAEIDALIAAYEAEYVVAADLKKGGARHGCVREAARIEVGLRTFLKETGAKGYCNTFEDLYGMKQLPGIASQRLMADGFGFGAEGDWKTAALVRAVKVMGAGLTGGTSFMEDYTYNLDPSNPCSLVAHMLEVCPSIAESKPSLEVHPLGIGGKQDPARLVFNTKAGPATATTLISLGNRFRMIVNEVDVIKTPHPMPKLPVAQAVWKPRPNFETSCAAWIYGGGAHHSAFSLAVTTEMLEDFARIAGIECLVIDADTKIRDFEQQLRTNEVYYALNKGWTI